jgi:hypothetical protein
MGTEKEHQRDCKKILGKAMANVHAFLDQYAEIFPPMTFQEYHRTFLHNSYGLAIVRYRWGKLGEKAFLIHLVRDYLWAPVSNWELVEKYKAKALIHFDDLRKFEPRIKPGVVESWHGESLCSIAFSK